MKLQKQCSGCLHLKPLDAFYETKRGAMGRRARCKQCCNEESRTWQTTNRTKANAIAKKHRTEKPERVQLSRKRHRVRKTFGLTLEVYEKLTRDELCAICKRHVPPSRKCLDHDHVTGKVRGLLCGKCNTGLGCFSDNVDTLLAAVNYLNAHADS